jgi:uncharacterized protein
MANDNMLSQIEISELQYCCEHFTEEGHLDPALEKFAKFAARGSETAMLYLGWIYSKGAGVQTDTVKAEAWFRRAAQNGSLDAQYYLGRHLVSSGDTANGMECLRKASADYIPAQYELGMLLFNSRNSDGDRKRGLLLLKAAARKGHVFAKRELGSAMVRGKLGLLAIPHGLWMLLSGLFGALRHGYNDPGSDNLR